LPNCLFSQELSIVIGRMANKWDDCARAISRRIQSAFGPVVLKCVNPYTLRM